MLEYGVTFGSTNDTTVTAGKGLDFGNKTMQPTRVSTPNQTATSPLIKMI